MFIGKVMELNIKNISEYIVENYLDCCLAYNIKNHEYSEIELFQECEDFFVYELLGICGCGNPESVVLKIKILLNIFHEFHKNGDFDEKWNQMKEDLRKEFGADDVYENDLLLFMVYILNDRKILEHGSSVGGSWLSNLGEMFLYILNNHDSVS
jgi:hypothetical protein